MALTLVLQERISTIQARIWARGGLFSWYFGYLLDGCVRTQKWLVMGGCFLPCFGASYKHRKSQKKQSIVPSVDQRYGTYESLQPTKSTKLEVEKNIEPIITDSKYECEEQLDGNVRKKVTFDLNVKTYEEFSPQKIKNCSVECEKEKEKEKEREKKEDTQNESQSLSDSSMSSVFSYPPSHRYHNCPTIDDDQSEDMELVETDSDDNDHALAQEEESSESLFSLSIESRKRVSISEMDEKEVNSPITIRVLPDQEMMSTGSNQIARDSVLNPVENLTQWKAAKERRAFTPLKGQEKENINLEQEISVPLSEEPSFKSLDQESMSTGLNQIARDSVLNPVENFTQWRAVRTRAFTPLKGQEKENINSEQEINIPLSEEPSFKSSKHGSGRRSNRAKQEFNEIAVITSLSSWLVESETTPITKSSPNSVGNSPERANSSRNNEDRPILGVLTVEDLKQLSASSSPRRSPRRSPEEVPIIGSVGSYWNHTGQVMMDSDSGSSSRGMPNTTSKYRENKRVKWHSTLFEKRLEGALDCIAQV